MSNFSLRRSCSPRFRGASREGRRDRADRSGAPPAAMSSRSEPNLQQKLADTLARVIAMREAQSGDLLFFHQPWVQRFPYHVMIFLGEARTESEDTADWVVYHTGGSPDEEGPEATIRKVRLAVLDKHPNARWRPLPSNPHFLGFYRLKILD